MVAFTYIAKRSDGEWKATRISAEESELSAEASSTYVLQQTLKKLSIENSDGGSVATLFSTINEDTVIFQVGSSRYVDTDMLLAGLITGLIYSDLSDVHLVVQRVCYVFIITPTHPSSGSIILYSELTVDWSHLCCQI